MGSRIRNIAWIVALAAVMVIAGAPGVLKAAPRGNGGMMGNMGMAQAGQGRMADRQQRMQARMDSMCAFLGLNDEQKNQVKDLFDAQREEMRSTFQKVRNNELSREEARELMQQNMEEHRKQLESLLTAEQKGKLKQWEKEHPRRRPPMEGPPGGGMRGETQSMGARHGTMGPASAREPLGGVLMGLRRRLDLSDQQVAEFRQLAGATMNEFFDKFSTMLDKDQQQKLQDIRERFKERREMTDDGSPGE